jgi:hypothetical protein
MRQNVRTCLQHGIFNDRSYAAVMSSPNELLTSGQDSFSAQVCELVSNALRRSHRLSKDLSGFQREEEFRNRADLASILIISGRAHPNRVEADGSILLLIHCKKPFCVHQYPNRLHPVARARIGAAVPNISAKCSLKDQLEAKGRDTGFAELCLPGKNREIQ